MSMQVTILLCMRALWTRATVKTTQRWAQLVHATTILILLSAKRSWSNVCSVGEIRTPELTLRMRSFEKCAAMQDTAGTQLALLLWMIVNIKWQVADVSGLHRTSCLIYEDSLSLMTACNKERHDKVLLADLKYWGAGCNLAFDFGFSPCFEAVKTTSILNNFEANCISGHHCWLNMGHYKHGSILHSMQDLQS